MSIINTIIENTVQNIVNDMKLNKGWVATETFTEDDLKNGLRPGISSVIETNLEIIKQIITAGIVTPTDGGASLKSSMLTYIENIKS